MKLKYLLQLDWLKHVAGREGGHMMPVVTTHDTTRSLTGQHQTISFVGLCVLEQNCAFVLPGLTAVIFAT